jgi:acetylornithine aminotransferase
MRGNKAIKDLRGRGLMMGIELNDKYLSLRDKLMFDEQIFTGNAKSNIIRLLPPLSLTIQEADKFLKAFNRQIDIIDNE